jgi:tRNA threonylcarbamoyladenosine biosynthesis protein TsaE
MTFQAFGQHQCPNSAAQEALGAALALALPHGTVLVLLGDLGAGKTTLVRGLARGLGSLAQVSSPTYNLIHEYPTPQGPLVHVDAYRLDSPARLWQMALAERLEEAALGAIEWGAALLPELEQPVVIEIETVLAGDESEGRMVTVRRGE